MSLNYRVGDATQPIGDGRKIIVHICNDVGAWGAGFVLAISKRWPAPEIQYRQCSRYPLGSVEFIPVEYTAGAEWMIGVANLIGQTGVGRDENGRPPIRYDAVLEGLQKVATWCIKLRSMDKPTTVHMPRIGCGLAGGDWRIMEAIIQVALIDKGVDVTVYDLR